MPKVRENPEKWARNSSQAGVSYKEGTDNPRRQWEEAALDGEGNFEVGITQAISNKRYSKGITKAGQEAYKAAIAEKGVSRFTQGVVTPSAKARYKSGFAPYVTALEALTLPPRQPKGQNIERVRLVNDAMIAEKNKA